MPARPQESSMPRNQTHQGLFITASDTGVGKTRIARELLLAARARGLSVCARKPVESGCDCSDGECLASDAHILAEAAAEPDDRVVTPYRFTLAAAPDRAARAEGCRIHLEQLEAAVRRDVNSGDFLVVEGAGGLCSPLAEDGLNLDLAGRLGLPLLIVIADRLGAINQALLTLRTARAAGLETRAILLNPLAAPSPGEPDLDNAEDLRRHCDVPVLSGRYDCSLEELPDWLFD